MFENVTLIAPFGTHDDPRSQPVTLGSLAVTPSALTAPPPHSQYSQHLLNAHSALLYAQRSSTHSAHRLSSVQTFCVCVPIKCPTSSKYSVGYYVRDDDTAPLWNFTHKKDG